MLNKKMETKRVYLGKIEINNTFFNMVFFTCCSFFDLSPSMLYFQAEVPENVSSKGEFFQTIPNKISTSSHLYVQNFFVLSKYFLSRLYSLDKKYFKSTKKFERTTLSLRFGLISVGNIRKTQNYWFCNLIYRFLVICSIANSNDKV